MFKSEELKSNTHWKNTNIDLQRLYFCFLDRGFANISRNSPGIHPHFSSEVMLHCTSSSSLAPVSHTARAAAWLAAEGVIQLCLTCGAREWERSHGTVLQMSVIQV